MQKKVLVLVLILFFVGASVVSAYKITVVNEPKSMTSDTRGNWLYVGGNGTGNYTSIQSAINAANPSDTVFVYNGTYTENVNINKNRINLIGEDKNSTIINNVSISVSADYVNISRFKILGLYQALNLYGNYSVISDNIIADSPCCYGILCYSNYNIIKNNYFINIRNGTALWGGDNNLITQNWYINNDIFAVCCPDNAENNTIYHNNFINNGCFDEAGNNLWDNGYPCGGNYWDDYTGLDNNGDGIGDTPYNISGGSNQDNYPFMNPNGWEEFVFVDDDAPPNWYDATHVHTIQEGINNASIGDTVFVYNGTYYENVIIDKSINLIGEDKNSTIIEETGGEDTIHIENANNVNVSGFTIICIDHGLDQGCIEIYTSNNISIIGCIMDGRNSGNDGVGIYSSNFCYIAENIIFDVQWQGIRAGTINNCIIDNNKIENTGANGIQMFSNSHNNQIINNELLNNGYYAIRFGASAGATNNYIYHNNFLGKTCSDESGGTNDWDNGYPSGGNYWSIYSGNDDFHGPNQDIPGSDGIIDAPYSFNGGQDNYPFMNPNGWLTPLNPDSNAYAVFYPKDDTYIIHRSGQTDLNRGDFDFMEVENYYGESGIWGEDTLIKFNISSIPDDYKIISATLKIYYHVYQTNNPAGRELNISRVTSNWDEDTVTWDTRPSYASEPTSFDTVPTSPGVWMSWDVTSDVQGFLNESYTNYGWKISDDTYWGTSNIPVTSFRTKENICDIPYLEIEIADVYVDNDANPSWYDSTHVHTIQEGINNATSGDTVFVYNGTYYENVVVDKTINLVGESEETTIIDAQGYGNTVTLTASNINLSHFKITGGESSSTFKNFGLFIASASNNNLIEFCKINENNGRAVYASYTYYNTFENCSIKNSYGGMAFDLGYDNHYTTIINCNISNNAGIGIKTTTPSSYLKVLNSTISNNIYGFWIENSDYHLIVNNVISNNKLGGAYFKYGCHNNVVYHNNFLNNTIQAFDDGNNFWDDGYPSGGNYWDDYTGLDNNGDGIGDIPYYISGGSNQDFYPLMQPWGTELYDIYVDDDAPLSWYDATHVHTIQEGINNASVGNTVFVYNGTYYEHISVIKQLYLIGEDKNNTIIDGGGSGYVVSMSNNLINMSYFTIKNCGSGDHDALILVRSYNTIKNCILRNVTGPAHSLTNYGASGVHDVVISECEFYNTPWMDMAWGCSYISIINCSFFNSNIIRSEFGSTHISIVNCYSDVGSMQLKNSQECVVRNCTLGNTIELDDGDYCIIENNTIFGGYYGIVFADEAGGCNNNIVRNNTISNCEYGYSDALNWGCTNHNNIFYHNNFINNTINAHDCSLNTWDNGYPSSGNYWSDFDEPNEGAWDNNTDGIADNPYPIPGGSNQDNYPLMYPTFGPIPDFNMTLYTGWNLIGWYHNYDTTAMSLSENITGCISVCKWNATEQTYNCYIVGGPPTFDFTITQGMGLFVDVSVPSIWHGEG